ncbi:MAG: FtsK/SpoIIIE domain-containing protein [Aeromicrobium sp.]
MSREHLDRLQAELAAKAEALAVKAARVGESLAHATAGGTEQARTETEAARTRAEDVRDRAVEQVRLGIEARRADIDRHVAELSSASATGVFGASFETPWSPTSPAATGAPQLIRRGAAAHGPALFPFFHDRGWYLDGPTERTIAEIQAVLLRAVAGLPLKHLRIDVFDPRIEGRLGGFAPLRSARAATFPSPATSSSAFREVLESVMTTAAANAEAIATEHVHDLGELWRARGLPVGDYRLVVVLNYPEGVDRETQSLLTRLARSGGPNGVSLVVQHDAQAQPADDAVSATELASHLRKSRAEASDELLLSGYPEGVPVSQDGAPPAALMSSVIAAAIEGATSDSGPVVPLADLIEHATEQLWAGDSTDGIETAIARVGQRPLSIGLRSQNPPVSNILVGGAVGQGKSNLLLDIIYGLAARYSPDDLELHLLDFKRGLEFQRFAADADGKNWLPHAKVLSLESDRSFGVAVLRHVVRDLESRAALFKKHGASGIDEYRRATGAVLPRLLLVVDEFQVMFDGDDPLTDEAVELLETISRQGRASGVHLILSSQTTSGVSGLRVKGESIFAQFPVRISLKNTVNESEAILSQGNKAAADLAYRGEIIINRNFGHDPEGSNERAISAYAEPGFVADLQARLWQRDPSGSGPLVFVSTDFATWPSSLPARVTDGAAIGLIGRPVEVTAEPARLLVDQDVDQAVAVVGSDETLVVPVLQALLRSLGASLGLGRVIVIDLTSNDSGRAGRSVAAALDELAAAGTEIVRVGRADGADALAGLNRETLRESPDRPTLVLGLGWQRWTGLDDGHRVHPDDEDDYSTVSLQDIIGELLQRGALRDIHFVGWWTTLRSLHDQLGYGAQGVRHFITAKLGLDDYRSLTSHTEPAVDGYPRVAHVDRAGDAGPTTVIPFVVSGRRA